jgi:hypothetical protein
MKNPLHFIIPAIVFALSPLAYSRGVYLEPGQFLAMAFPGIKPAQYKYWLNPDNRTTLNNILAQPVNSLRIKYWQSGHTTAWIIQDTGKTELITFGLVIKDNQIDQLHVLEFRESRGWEIRHPFFTHQFSGLGLNENSRLSGHIDNITGATLSVEASKRAAIAALYLDRQLDPRENPERRY